MICKAIMINNNNKQSSFLRTEWLTIFYAVTSITSKKLNWVSWPKNLTLQQWQHHDDVVCNMPSNHDQQQTTNSTFWKPTTMSFLRTEWLIFLGSDFNDKQTIRASMMAKKFNITTMATSWQCQSWYAKQLQ